MSRVCELEPVTTWDVTNDIRCWECSDPFQPGTYYVTRAVDEWQEYRDQPVTHAICIPCAFTDA